MNVETIFNARRWDENGMPVNGAQTSAEALRLSGIDWSVSTKSITIQGEDEPIPDTYANVRDSDNSVLGLVSGRYKIVQNREAFAFTDSLLGEGVKYTTAGSLKGGRRTWLQAEMSTTKVVGEDVSPYLVFSNSFDGTASIKVALVPIRVVCQNTLTLALKQASRTWSFRHKGDIEGKLDEARQTLALANTYMYQLDKTADELTQIYVPEHEITEIINTVLLPIGNDKSDRAKNNIMVLRDSLRNIYDNKDDIKRFKNTAYGMVNAVADFEAHTEPLREAATAKENRFMTVVDTSPLMTLLSNYFKISK